MTDPIEIWDGFASGATRQGVLLKRVRSKPPSDLHLGMRFPGRLPLLLARVDDLTLVDQATQETTALRCVVDRSEVAGSREAAVVVELIDPAHTDIFGVLVRDLISGLADGLPDGELLTVLGNRLTRWQQLLRRKRSGLSLEQQRGLFGELVVLRQLWDAGGEPATTLGHWVGPSGAVHDWESDVVDTEVKARASTRQSVRISSEFQLDSRDGQTDVALVIATIDTTPDGQSLPDLVDELALRLDDEERETYETRLFEYGWFDVHRPRYEGTSWTVRDVSGFAVDEDFPRVVPAALPEGVSGVTYSLDVSALADHSTDLADLVARMIEVRTPDGT